MTLLDTMLMITSFVLLALAAAGVPSGRFNLLAGGLAAYVLAQLLRVF